MNEPGYRDFFDLRDFPQPGIFSEGEAVWEVLKRLDKYLSALPLNENHADMIGNPVITGPVHIGRGTRIDPGVYIQGPVWIGENVHIRQGAYLRGGVLAGDGCVLGNSCEFKNCILLNEVQVPHYSYVGDSILGGRCHLGAGVICSNLRTDQSEIAVEWEGARFATGLRKLGVIAGDGVEVGCQAVLNPGSLLGKDSWLQPGVIWAGSCPSGARIINRNIQKY